MGKYELSSSNGLKIPLEGNSVRLGRSPENEVSIQDPALSRNHLLFKITADGSLTVEDAGSQSGYSINGSPAQGISFLKPGDRIKVGSFEYILSTIGDVPGSANFFPGTGKTQVFPGMARGKSSSSQQTSRTFNAPPRDISFSRMLGGFVVALVIAAVYLRKIETEKASRNPASVEQNFSVPSKGMSQEGYRPDNAPTKSLTEVRSEAQYKESLRDYYNKNYSRAVLGFKDALLLNPAHVEATDYLQMSENELKAQLEEAFEDGTRSFSNLQFRRARSQALRILTILSEQVPSYSRQIAQEISSSKSQKAISQEEILEKLPCDKSRSSELCKKAKDLLKDSRRMLREEETLK